MTQMKLSRLIRILILIALPLTLPGRGSASSVQGKVTEIVDGQRVIVESLKQPVKIRLVAVAAPEQKQHFADVAKRHLSDLLLNKFVVVRVVFLDRDGYLVGRVLVEDWDVGRQMIRDGVAWYDTTADRDLDQQERESYAACQDAARNEHRGLWQDESPMAPWEFRRAQEKAEEAANASAYAFPLPRPRSSVRRSRESSFSTDGFAGGLLAPGAIAGKPEFRRISPGSSVDKWLRFQPEDHHFSILVPGDSLEVTFPVLDGQGTLMTVHSVVGTRDRVLYHLIWAKGIFGNPSDSSFAAEMVNGLVKQINHAFSEARVNFVVTAQPVREYTSNGYAARQYLLSGDEFVGTVRFLTKRSGNEREFFMLCVLNTTDKEPTAAQFLNSFAISRN